jgi:hypothetical protein
MARQQMWGSEGQMPCGRWGTRGTTFGDQRIRCPVAVGHTWHDIRGPVAVGHTWHTVSDGAVPTHCGASGSQGWSCAARHRHLATKCSRLTHSHTPSLACSAAAARRRRIGQCPRSVKERQREPLEGRGVQCCDLIVQPQKETPRTQLPSHRDAVGPSPRDKDVQTSRWRGPPTNRRCGGSTACARARAHALHVLHAPAVERVHRRLLVASFERAHTLFEGSHALFEVPVHSQHL